MARFYLLPSRSFVGQQYAMLLRELFPGQAYGAADWSDLAESLAAGVARPGESYVIFGEDLADDAPTEIVLHRDFGAEAGDEVIDIRAGNRFLETTCTHHALGRRAAA